MNNKIIPIIIVGLILLFCGCAKHTPQEQSSQNIKIELTAPPLYKNLAITSYNKNIPYTTLEQINDCYNTLYPVHRNSEFFYTKYKSNFIPQFQEFFKNYEELQKKDAHDIATMELLEKNYKTVEKDYGIIMENANYYANNINKLVSLENPVNYIEQVFGSPNAINIVTANNRHEEGHIDSFPTYIYDGMTMTFWQNYDKSRSFCLKITITGNNIVTPFNIRIGASKEQINTVLGERYDLKKYSYFSNNNCYSYDYSSFSGFGSRVVLSFNKKDALVKIEWYSSLD